MIRLICFAAILWAWGASAQQSTNPTNGSPTQSVQAVDTSPLREIGSKYHNGIKLLQNRFRIDYKVDEITMVFFRKYGSAPIVLVRPDGSKIFLTQADDNEVEWYDSATYDMIRMKNPMPGPWQAVGQILPGSRVMVLSDIELKVEPLPKILFSGEILKQTAFLTNGGKAIDYSEFRDVVRLTMEFISTNNPNYNNFGAQTQTIATFEDNGKGMDERPLDGTFTGQFNLSIPSGEWKPVFTVATPMFSREQIDEPLVLHENPINIEVDIDETGESFHKLLVDADRDKIDMSSLLIDGKVRFPNGDVQNFSITRLSEEVRTYDIVNYEYGIFRVKLTAYGNTVDGRDFILDVPEFNFLSEEPLPEPSEAAAMSELPSDALSAEALALQELEQSRAALPEEEAMSTATLMLIIGIVNMILVLVGALVIWFIVTQKNKGRPINIRSLMSVAKLKQQLAKLASLLAGLKDKVLPKKKAS